MRIQCIELDAIMLNQHCGCQEERLRCDCTLLARVMLKFETEQTCINCFAERQQLEDGKEERCMLADVIGREQVEQFVENTVRVLRLIR